MLLCGQLDDAKSREKGMSDSPVLNVRSLRFAPSGWRGGQREAAPFDTPTHTNLRAILSLSL